MRKFRDFEEARDFVQKLNIESQKKWRDYCNSGKKPSDIPTNPNVPYKNIGWISWGDWLGTNRIRNTKFKTFTESREFVHLLNLKNSGEWKKYRSTHNKPNFIPASPDFTYKNKGWNGWEDWLGITKK